MTAIATLALGLGLFAAEPVAPATHSVVVDHPSGRVDARYGGSIVVEHKQVGAVAPPGRAGTLRCAWTARLSVDRVATTASAGSASRSFVTNPVLNGSRPGWCNRTAIDQEVAARLPDTGVHLADAAREDQPVLRAEVDRLHGPA